MTLPELTEQVRQRAQHAEPFEATAKIVTEQGIVYVDGQQAPVTISNEDKAADCEMHIGMSDLIKLGQGDLNPMMAVMTGKLKIKGDMGVAMKLGKLLG